MKKMCQVISIQTNSRQNQSINECARIFGKKVVLYDLW